jgi:alkylhydroperoxidase family enzyme
MSLQLGAQQQLVAGPCSARRPALLPPRRRHRRAPRPLAALQPEHVDALAASLGHLDALSSQLSHMLTLAYEPIVLPCSSMNCGDVMHRRWAGRQPQPLKLRGQLPERTHGALQSRHAERSTPH